MATTVSGSVTLSGSITEKSPTGAVVSNGLVSTISHKASYSTGSGANQINLLYSQPFSAAAAPLTLDLTALAEAINGVTITNDFARVRELLISVHDANAGHLVTVYHGASNGVAWLPAVGSALTVPSNGGCLYLSDPQSVGGTTGFIVDSTHKNIVIDPGANTVVGSIEIAGCDAAS
jgi:hypothetical protein